MICNFRRDGVRLDSQQFKEGWLKIEESSTLTIGKPFERDDWKYLMEILAQVDVSRVEHLVLKLPYQCDNDNGSPYVVVFGDRELGAVLRTGRFSALKTLRILASLHSQNYDPKYGPYQQVATTGLEAALQLGQFTNLRILSLPINDVNAMLEASQKASMSQLISLTIIQGTRYTEDVKIQEWDAVLEHLKRLQHLDLHGIDALAPLLTEAIISGQLPCLTSSRLVYSFLGSMDLAGLVKAPKNWFFSLECIAVSYKGYIGQVQVCSLVD